ncbi:MAG: hypothetical protein E5Y34_01950 [Mesorhizobium sp.]|nr:MAG: hypothetical protein E5Y34_01950 [Mesorhizobium sp.]
MVEAASEFVDGEAFGGDRHLALGPRGRLGNVDRGYQGRIGFGKRRVWTVGLLDRNGGLFAREEEQARPRDYDEGDDDE